AQRQRPGARVETVVRAAGVVEVEAGRPPPGGPGGGEGGGGGGSPRGGGGRRRPGPPGRRARRGAPRRGAPPRPRARRGEARAARGGGWPRSLVGVSWYVPCPANRCTMTYQMPGAGAGKSQNPNCPWPF